MTAATFFYDIASPYAYLSAEQLAGDDRFAWQPVLAGAIFQARGHGSWALTEQRAARIAEIDGRAAAYGLPPIAWRDDWPGTSLPAMRAAVWATAAGAGEAFALACFRRVFRDGADTADVTMLQDAATEAGLDAAAVPAALSDPAVKAALRAATDAAYAEGVRGIPSFRVGGRVFFGDDQLATARMGLPTGS